MDFQSIVDGMNVMACIVSVEDLGNGSSGKYRIVTGNQAYIDSIEKPAPGTSMLKDKFIPNTEYTDYLTRDLNFEAACYQAAVMNKCVHSYAHPDRMPVWFNMNFLPVNHREGHLRYCMYLMEIGFEADSENMSDIDGKMAAEVLQTCIKLRGTNNFAETIKDVIKDIRELCEAEHCCILTMDTYNRRCSVLGEAFGFDTPLISMENYLDENFYKIAESWEGTIAGSNCLIAKNDEDMLVVKERNPVWYESLTRAGAKNIILFPLKSGEELLGYIWAINFNADNALKIKETLELTTFILGSELSNYFLVDKLKILSSTDMLTGVMNRNEMNNYVSVLCNVDMNTSVVVIFADLNGLKTINDNNGHNAGDQLLKDAARILSEVFDKQYIFRAGGDEFSIILKGLSEKEMNDKIKKLRELSEKSDNVCFAIGGAYEENNKNVRLALRKADENMYEDKKKFYNCHPEKKMR